MNGLEWFLIGLLAGLVGATPLRALFGKLWDKLMGLIH